jgi:hypothetical protein
MMWFIARRRGGIELHGGSGAVRTTGWRKQMQEIKGNLWDYFGRKGYVVLITTNGYVRKNGECVMGKGCAAEAKAAIPGLAKQLGEKILQSGNKVYWFGEKGFYLMSFPVKDFWWERARLGLIRESAYELKRIATGNPDVKFVLPRPGCGSGNRTWDEVEPMLLDLPDNVLVITK